jgi:hypothetical protein
LENIFEDDKISKLKDRKLEYKILLRSLEKRGASKLDLDILRADIADIQYEIDCLKTV